MIDQALQNVIDWISKIAPEVWRIAIRQVQANAFETGIWVIFGLIVGITALVIGIKMAKSDNDDVQIASIFVIIFLGIFPTILSVNGITKLIHYLYNPEFYAIQLLISTLTGK